MEKEHKDESALMKRNNQAPSFTSSIVRSRSQLLIERYIQAEGYDLQEYIDAQRILKLSIPPEILRSWYPTPNWKKDINKMVRSFMEIEGKPDKNGNFRYMSLFSKADLLDDGLHLNIDPEVLQLYIITNGNPLTSIDYNLTTYFTRSFSYEFYWQMCIHDHPSCDYRFYFTPEDINKKFKTNYQNSNIVSQIIEPSREEIKKLFDEKLTPRYFTVSERREVIGKCKQIVGWEFIVHNESRKQRIDIQAQEAYGKINQFLIEHFDKYRTNILSQIKTFPSDKIIQIWMRLERFETEDTTRIRTKEAYLYFIFQRYGINPRSPKIDSTKILEAPLFEKEEKDTAAGINYWMQCLKYINDSSATPQIKELFEKLRFYSYIENEKESIMTFSTSLEVYKLIEAYFIDAFKEVLLKHFPKNLKIAYNVDRK